MREGDTIVNANSSFSEALRRFGALTLADQLPLLALVLRDELDDDNGLARALERSPARAPIIGKPFATPLENTYWVVCERMLAGEHPWGGSKSDTRLRIDRLHQAGINYFIDLTEENEVPDYRRLLPKQTHYLRCAIPDSGVPDDIAHMHELQSRIRTELTLGRRIYIHCRAGIGRTGLVVGCYLAEGGLDGEAALKELNQLWSQSERAESWPVVPQTEEQADYIRNWPLRRKILNDAAPGTRPRLLSATSQVLSK